MGNDNNKKQADDSFTRTCHPAFITYHLDQPQQLFYALARMEQAILDWRNNIDELLNAKYLLMPHKIMTHEPATDFGCFVQEDFHRMEIQNKVIYYQFYPYTLLKEIETRREKLVSFREAEVWKIMGVVGRAIREWHQVYPTDNVGLIYPKNIVINSQGKARLVCRASFFDNQYTDGPRHYLPPESRHGSVIKYARDPTHDPFAIESRNVYSLGVTLLEVMTLESAQNEINTEDKLTLARSNEIYSISLKDLVTKMVDSRQQDRPKIAQIIEECRKYRSSFREI